MGSDAVIDVRSGRVPANHLPPLVSEGVVSNEKPTVLAIPPKGSLFYFEWKPACESSVSLIAQSLQVVRVEDSFAKLRSKHIFRGETRIVERRLVGVDRPTGLFRSPKLPPSLQQRR